MVHPPMKVKDDRQQGCNEGSVPLGMCRIRREFLTRTVLIAR
jgi:hypothetical protein